MVESTVELFWLPVGAGTHFQRASLVAYDWCLSHIARRPRAAFVHAALKVKLEGRTFTLELMPVPAHQNVAPLLTGPVGISIAGRLRLFRYQLVCRETDSLPDEGWAINSPVLLSTDAAFGKRLMALAPLVPANVWVAGRPAPRRCGHLIRPSRWLLHRTGLDAAALQRPPGTQAPGWAAGIQVAEGRGQVAGSHPS